jgi:hypothetical protein
MEVELDDILEGTERESLLVYDSEVTQVVIKIISECFKTKINLYSIQNQVDFEFISYTPVD